MRIVPLRIDPYLLLLFGLSIFALAPLLAPGYFYSAHDGRHSVFFVTMFDEAIRSGALWPRWAMHHNQGYGYPTFLLQAPFAFYVAEAFVLLGVGITNAVKITWALGFLAGAWGMYRLVRTWILGDSAQPTEPGRAERSAALLGAASLSAVIAGLLYTYAPYHLLDIYVRAAFAETLLLAWFPWVFLAFDRLIVRGTSTGWQGRLLVAALSYAGLLLTHSLALLAFTPLLMVFVCFRLWTVWRRGPVPEILVSEKPQDGRNGTATSQSRGSRSTRLLRSTVLAAGAGVAAVLLAAIFLIPLFMEGSLIVQDEWTRNTYNYTRHFVHWGQFLSPFWGYGYSDDPNGANDGMGFQLGMMLSLLLIVAAFLLLLPLFGRNRRAASTHGLGETSSLSPLMLFLLLVTLATLAIMTPAADRLWAGLSALAVVQFPWRFLGIAVFSASALGGLTIWRVASEGDRWGQTYSAEGGLLVVALLVCFASFTYARPEAYQPIEPWREDGRAVMEFEREHPDMVATTRFVDEPIADSPLTEQYLADDFSLDSLNRLEIIAGEGEVVRHSGQGHAFSGEVVMTTPGTLQILLYYFPGWQVKLNGVSVPHRVSPPHGLIETDLPAGRHQIDIRMGSTPARTAGALITALTLVFLLGLWLYGRGARPPGTAQ